MCRPEMFDYIYSHDVNPRKAKVWSVERTEGRKVKYIVRHKIRDKSTRSIALENADRYLRGKASLSVLAHVSRAYPSKKAGQPEGEGLSVNEGEIIKRAKEKYKAVCSHLHQIYIAFGNTFHHC